MTKQLVSRSPDRAWGATVFAGTRVPVDILFDYLAAGDTLDDFLKQFPTVSRNHAVAVLEAAKERAASEATAVEIEPVSEVIRDAVSTARSGTVTRVARPR